MTFLSEPVGGEPKLAAASPEPMAAGPELAAAAPETTAAGPESAAAPPKTTAARPKSAAAPPKTTAAGPESAAAASNSAALSGNYLTDNPALYEARFPDPGRLAARWAEDCLRRHGSGPRLLDLGCGTGRDAAWLHRGGRTVTGADLSEAMLAHARSEHPGPAYVRADLHRFDLGRFDAVTCLDSALLYCHTDEQLDGCLGSVRRALTPGGLLVAELRNGAYFLGRTDLLDTPSVNSFAWQGVSYRSTTTLTIDRTAQLLRRLRIWEAEDGDPVEQRSAWRLLFPLELRHRLAAHGFEVLELHDGPGPRTEPPWQEGLPPGTETDADRLHVVARLTTR